MLVDSKLVEEKIADYENVILLSYYIGKINNTFIQYKYIINGSRKYYIQYIYKGSLLSENVVVS